MKLVDMTIRDFVNEVDSAKPAPGGGSSSAVAASIGVGLLRMVGHLTIPKKKFQKLDKATQDAFIDNHEALQSHKRKLLDLVDKDTEAFNDIMQAFKMPKETDADKKKRQKAIESATLVAIEVPEMMADLAYEALKMVDLVRRYGNKNAVSDAGVSALLLYAAIEGALLNVKTNIPGLSDPELAKKYREKADATLHDARVLKEEVVNAIHDAL